MARRRQKERIESLKEGKEEERKGQVLNTERERERERERESHMCKKDCFYKTTIVWPSGRDKVSNFSIFLLRTSKS